MVIRRLAFSNFAQHKIRVALTVAAIALSVSLVVSVTSGYASVEAAIYGYLSQYMGSTDVELIRYNDPATGFSEQIVSDLRADPDVHQVDGRYEASLSLAATDPNQQPRRAAVIGIRRPGDTRSDYLQLEQGGWFNTSDGDEVVIDQAVAEHLHVKLGDTFTVPIQAGPMRLKVVGVVHKPSILASYMQTVYVPLETLQRYAGRLHTVNRVMIDLKPGVDPGQFVDRWKSRLPDPNLRLRSARETRQQMDKNLLGAHVLSYLGGTVSMLAATFIVFSALSMGVAERQRTLAMLRAVGAYRSQIGVLVVFEGILLATFGVIAGIPLGWCWVKALSVLFPSYFSAGVVLSKGGMLFGAGGSILAALVASFLPAFSAMRVSPLEAMSPLAQPPRLGPPWRPALIGLVLICVDPFLFFGPLPKLLALLGIEQPNDAARSVQFFAHFGLGLPCVMLGFFLLAPMFVWISERVAGPVVAGMLALPYELLRQQLSGGVWRAAGTAAALMVGLAVLVVMQTNGNTMLKGWRLPTKFPDIFILTPPTSGLNVEQQKLLSSVQGIRPGEVMPIGIASPEYGSGLLGIGMAAVMPNATMFIGVEPDKAFKMMELEFREGSANAAARELARGDALVVTEEFRQLKNLHVGDQFPLKTNLGEVNFRIVGVVWSPGIDVMVSMFDMGKQFDQRTAASVFGSLDDGRKYFGIGQVYLFAANLENAVDKEQLLKDVQKTLNAQGMRAGDVRHIKDKIVKGFEQLLLLLSTVAFAAMAVASLGVTNTIMASVRSRRWQFGVLRSIGVTRWQLLRLVLAEGVLLGIVGCALGLAAGFEMAMNANQLSIAVTGYNPPIAVPWKMVSIGAGIIFAISLLASVGPAIAVSRTETLSLLQAGRGAA